ncbi:MnmC family methyltransferase [Arcobacter sp.]|uniref:MnmC family methyltransferase n=1 Tax=unclassified Arcobacter TaxID=2593671 RepID=UPI003B003683|eukprot:TRINITY_DN14769_c0_g1_i3.p1 TRINITY_DN14769_c0_g1~~TRINITY_DN14769_c0_g1_i3.p1  ORF type:complete len:244 (-),score=-45.69 TRINITY_DN14769_c0_g1_i3:581-1312(-)
MNKEIQTIDGSNTLFSTKYNQHFHDLKTGAIKESLNKHVIPALRLKKDLKKLKILDICFGIGYNTFSTIYYILENNLDINLEIYSPELDEDLIKSLDKFTFPKEFEKIKHIINSIAKNFFYEDEKIKIEVFIGDARKYIKTLNDIDIVYQDAFSSEVNKELWSVEYFQDIFKLCKDNAIMTTYSISSNVRLSMYEAGFFIYEINPSGNRKQTIALKSKKDIEAKYIDMELKKSRNKEAKAFYD